MKFSRLFALLCFASILCSCDRDEIDVNDNDYDPASFVWQKKTFVPYSYCPGIGPSADMVPDDGLLRLDSAMDQSSEVISWSSIGTSIVTGAASGVGSFLAGQLLSTVFAAFMDDGQQEIMDALDGISSELNNLKSLANDILNRLDEMEMNDLMSKFDAINAKLSLFDEFNRSYFEQIENAIKHDASEKELNEMVVEWGNTTIDGWPACVSAKDVVNDILNFRFQYNGVNINYCMVIDMLAFDMFPWESQGYDFRDMYRGETAAKIARCLYLSGAYYSTRGLLKSVEGVESYAMSLAEYFEACEVDRRNDYAVCQIQDAHFAMKRDALVQRKGFYFSEKPNYYNWQKDATKCMGEKTSLLLEGKVSTIPDGKAADDYLSNQLTNKEIQAIMKYYTPTHPYDYTLLDCLEQGGVVVPDIFKSKYTMSGETPNYVTSFDIIYLGFADTRFYLHGPEDVPVMTDLQELHFGIQNFYMVGVPIGGVGCVEWLYGGWLPFFYANRIMGSYDDTSHTKSPQLLLNMGDYSYKKDGYYYYDKWAFYDVLQYNYPETFIMLKDGSMERY